MTCNCKIDECWHTMQAPLIPLFERLEYHKQKDAFLVPRELLNFVTMYIGGRCDEDEAHKALQPLYNFIDNTLNL